ncbi:MAG: type II secretion system F family protein [Deltaproteobacteria bacterium]|nr:type II secretion system F family protein [Deltaproteobacteria bacterium]
MAIFSYRAVGESGVSQKGTLTAASLHEAKSILKARNLFPMEVKPAANFSLNLQNLLSFSSQPSSSVGQVAVFARQFATLLAATIPYDKSLEMVIQQTGDGRFKSVLNDVKSKVVEGAYLADAFTGYPKVFPPMMISMVRAGEASGTLVEIMSRLADYYENLGRIRSRITSALIYPAFMTVFGTGVIIFMATYILPKITTLLENFGAKLPLSTRILIGFSNLLTGYWWLIILLSGLTGYWVHKRLQTPQGRMTWDRLELKLWVWRSLRKKMLLQRFVQTLGTLLKSGVELKAALEIASHVLENGVYRQAMVMVISDVQNKGLPLSVALKRSGLFPDDVTQMVAIGEETATMDTMLENLSTRMTQELTTAIDAMLAMFEPMMILAMGSIVGFMVVSMLLPMLQLNQLVG